DPRRRRRVGDMPRLGVAPSAWIPAMLAAFALAALVTWLAIGYARRKRLIDEPGMRRSHTQPTPRGGGIGIVVAVIACACIPALLVQGRSFVAAPALLAAVAIVAAVGWIDDHRGLSARTRFFAHCLAALVFLLPVIVPLILFPSVIEQRFEVPVAILWP